MQPISLPDSQRGNFSKLLEMEMLREQEDASVGAEEAFLRVALRTIGFDPDDGHDPDGPLDCGFDFINVTQEEASLFQAKSLAYGDGIQIDAKLDASYLGDLRRMIEVLKDLDNLPAEANKVVIEGLMAMRNEINRKALIPIRNSEASAPVDIEECPEYRVTIYFLGLARGFTPQAEEEFARLEATPPIKYGKVKLVVAVIRVFIDELLADKWQQRNVDWRDRNGKKREEVSLTVIGEPIVDAKSAVFFARAHDFVQAYEDFGYQIFEPNVRCELKESKVNQAIKKTITTREGRREFKHLNNGITVVCSGWSAKKSNGGKITSFVVRQLGIVNGLQTVKSLHDAFRRLSQEDQIDFSENCLVLCRLHQEGAVKRLEQLVKATNNQNPMKPRNLRSNDPEQVAFETIFAGLGWFYERKQGAWDAFKADPRGWRGLQGKRPEHFQAAGSNTYRTIDNDEMGQNWLAFIGFSTEAINEKRVIFDQDNLYSLIFLKKTAKHGFDYDFKLTLDSKVHTEATDGAPAPAAMLVALLSREVADSLAFSRRENREVAIKRLGLQDRSRDEQDRALDIDPTYQKQKMLRGMLTLFVEFIGFVLFRSLGDQMHAYAGRLLNNGTFARLAKERTSDEMVRQYRKRKFEKDDLMIILFGAFEHCVGQLYESSWLRGYNDAPVKNKFIYSTKTRRQLLEELTELDLRFGRGEWVRDWADGFNEAKGLFAYVRQVIVRG